MKTYTSEELKDILEQHKLWLSDNTKGKRADLRSADLSSADLSWANLRSADLSWANLRSADLRSADLRSADLRWADLRSADLRWANLSSADLSWANLDDKIISITQIGSRKGMTIYNFDKDILWCGCWTGTLAEFENRVKKTHRDNPQCLKEYMGAITYFKSLKEERK